MEGIVGMPHVCGDEPLESHGGCGCCDVCPTYVGMNRLFGPGNASPAGMPHVCGDEPHHPDRGGDLEMYAPRMWG